MTLTLRVAEELRFFLAPRHRGGVVRLDHDDSASLGHIVQSLGVPLTEVGALANRGREVSADYRPRAGDLIEVGPPPLPQALPVWPPRFVLDVHLGTLARRLRLVGVDTAYPDEFDDDTLIDRANAEQRVLLTRDRGLLFRRCLRLGAHVRADAPDAQLTEVLERFNPPLRPWTRCLACNGQLNGVAKADVTDELMAGTRATYDTFSRCASCGRVFWPGAHHHRLRRIVERARRAVAG
ncbi:Mut7-C RNAse domain-containing protein [Nocardiopsis rhodophaea]|uniref:Mut7-C RNAse domain-containing protein n=1 Tax=Nocardiopsis rhodophaea TaxID=280238 RepID=A0ABN2SZI9_9ACTN